MYLVTIRGIDKRKTLKYQLKRFEEGRQWRRWLVPAYFIEEENRAVALLLFRLKRRYKDDMSVYRVDKELTSFDLEGDYDRLDKELTGL